MVKEEETKDSAETDDATKTEKDAADAPEDAAPEPEDDDVAAVANAVADADTEDAAVEAGAAAGDDGATPKRRFFPRVRHLLQPEWEYVSFLVSVLVSGGVLFFVFGTTVPAHSVVSTHQ
jgi:hypothetical protein